MAGRPDGGSSRYVWQFSSLVFFVYLVHYNIKMKYLNFLKQFSVLVVLPLLFFACDKENDQNSIADNGRTLVKIIGGGTPANIVKTKIDFDSKPVSIQLADIRRDVAVASELNKVMTVMVKDDNAIVAANPAYTILPAALYSVGVETPKSGGYYTVTLNYGEFYKAISITIPNPKLLNPVLKYALGLTIATADAGGKISVQHSIIVEIVTINQWDGVYMNIGNPAAPNRGFTDVTNAAFTWGGNQQYSLVTIGPAACVVINDNYSNGGPGQMFPTYMFNNINAPNIYGSYGLVISFDSTTNGISEIHNSYGDIEFMSLWIWPALYDWPWSIPCMTGPPLYGSCNTRRAVLDPSGVNAVQPNRDIFIKHFMLQPSVLPAPSIRSYFDETWKYLRPR